MEITFKELAKREVINVPDGKSLGKLTDITLDFPRGILVGITVPAKRSILNCFGFGERLYIERYKIVKIGTDVILVDLKAEKKPPKPPIDKSPCNPCEAFFGQRDNFSNDDDSPEYE